MARRFNSSQFRSRALQLQSRLRQAQNKQRQNINRLNQKIRDLNRALDNYNREVSNYNARQRLNRQRLQSELARLNRQASTRHANLRASASRLHRAYEQMESAVASRPLAPQENFFLDISERETANSLGVANVLLEAPVEAKEGDTAFLQETVIEDEIAVISEDLDARWRGALFALNPANPEASRHFCSSSREIFTSIIETKVPAAAVFSSLPDCPRTERGNPTRRSKIQYLLNQKGLSEPSFVDFALEDIDNIIELFDILNSGTHGTSGRYSIETLAAIKTRVEGGLLFLSRVAA